MVRGHYYLHTPQNTILMCRFCLCCATSLIIICKYISTCYKSIKHNVKPESTIRINKLKQKLQHIAVHTRKVKLRPQKKILFTLCPITPHTRGNRRNIFTNIGEICLQKDYFYTFLALYCTPSCIERGSFLWQS